MSDKKPVSHGHPNTIKVAWVAHRGAGTETGLKACDIFEELMPDGNFELSANQPDILLFMSGGSERAALSLITDDHPVLLLSIRGHNAYAAATEVMAWMVAHNRFAILSDALDARDSGLPDKWRKTIAVWQGLTGRKAGLIGSVSEWLVASGVAAEKLKEVFGVTLTEIPWNTLPDYTHSEPDAALLSRFGGEQTPVLTDAARVLTLLRNVIGENRLDAVAVECFSLVQQRKVTACLALAQLNDEGAVAACEGDLASMAGMMLLGSVTHKAVWMANTTRIHGQTLTLSHCTAAFGLVKNTRLTSHFETGCSLAVSGEVNASEVTLFRLSDTLAAAFVAEGRVTGHPSLTNACRTQVEIELTPRAAGMLQNHPLGNHLVVAEGDHGDMLKLICRYKGITILE